jgi:hypothetical protein
LIPEKALELVAEIEGLIELGGRDDPPTLRRIEDIVRSLYGTSDTTGIVDLKLSEVRSWAEVLFTERKHERWNGGAEGIKHFIRMNCSSLKTMIRGAIRRAQKPLSR